MRLTAVVSCLLLLTTALVGACGDDETPSTGSDVRSGEGAHGGAHGGHAAGDSGAGHDHGTDRPGTGAPPDGPPAPPPGNTSPPPAVSAPAAAEVLRIRLTNGNEVQPITVVTDNGLGHQGWWRVIENGPPPFIELRTIPFPATCACDDPGCDRTVSEGPVDTLVLGPGDSADDTWDGTFYERVVEQGQQCQVARTVESRELRIQFTYSPGVEGLDGQLPQDTSLRSEPFVFGADDEATLQTP